MFSAGFHKVPWIPDFVYRDMLETMFSNRKEKKELLEELVVSDKDASFDTKYPQMIQLLWGAEDKFFDLDLATSMKTQLGEKTTLDSIKDAGHLAPIEKSSTYNKRLKSVLERMAKDQ